MITLVNKVSLENRGIEQMTMIQITQRKQLDWIKCNYIELKFHDSLPFIFYRLNFISRVKKSVIELKSPIFRICVQTISKALKLNVLE